MASTRNAATVVNEVRNYIEGVAKNLVERIWGADGAPWGTTMTELEDVVIAIRLALSEKMLKETLQRQAQTTRPPDCQNCPNCGRATASREPEPRLVHTRGGDAEWQEPREFCGRCRQAFFPSVEEFGSRSLGLQPDAQSEDRLCRLQ